MTREDIFDQDRGERDFYLKAPVDVQIRLPLTKDGFEALLERVASERSLPVDDAARMVLAGYVHHIPNEQDTTSIETLGKIFHKSVSNSTTWRIDQEIKLKRQQEAKDAADKAKLEQTNVLNMPPRPVPGENAQKS